jgi:phage FluMu gp28-like protein
MHLTKETFFLPYQAAWRRDPSPLRICVKGRQIGLTYADSYDSVIRAAARGGKDVWVMSRDELQAREYLRYCKRWAEALAHACEAFQEEIFDPRQGKRVSLQVLPFASGANIYALSSNPDAIVGKTGNVKLDEFALHRDQRTLYAVAKPVIQWGGTLSIISTHRGVNSVFNRLLKEIKEQGNPMGWSLHEIPAQKAVAQGLVERINAVTGRDETREEWLARQRRECIDEQQWLQEYCCVPAENADSFLSWDLIKGCEDESLVLQSLNDLLHPSPNPNPTLNPNPNRNPGLNHHSVLFVGVDVARRKDLCVIDVGEKIGDVVWDRVRIEMQGRTFSEIEAALYSILKLRQVKRACIDATGLGLQLAERAQEKFSWKVEPITFTSAVKEELAFGLRTDFQDRKLRIPIDENLRADLMGIKKEVTGSGHIRFAGETDDSHCDRFWAKALRQHAARYHVHTRATLG